MERLYRSESDRIIAGVCGGLAAYLHVDPLILRILFVVLAILNGIGVLVYLALWIVVPSAGSQATSQEDVIRHNVDEIGVRARELGQEARDALHSHRTRWRADSDEPDQRTVIGGAILIAIGLLILMNNFGLLWWASLARLWPLVLIGIGLVILLNHMKDRH